MKREIEFIVLGLLMLPFISCGKSSSGSGVSANPEVAAEKEEEKEVTTTEILPSPSSYYFAAKADLPSCTEALAQSLAYVASDKQFYVCSEKSWSEVDVGANSGGSVIKIDDIAPGSACASGGKAIKTGIDNNDNGVLDSDEIDVTQNICHGNSASNVDPFSVTKSYTALGDGTNLCDTYAPDENCYFEFGKVEVFANGNWQVSLSFRHLFASSGSDSDMDTSNLDVSFIMSKGEETGVFKRLDPYIFRNDGSGGNIWAVIVKEKQNVLIAHDTNGNFELDADDLIIGTYPLVKD